MATGKSNFRNEWLMEQWSSGYVRPYRLRSWPTIKRTSIYRLYNNILSLCYFTVTLALLSPSARLPKETQSNRVSDFRNF